MWTTGLENPEAGGSKFQLQKDIAVLSPDGSPAPITSPRFYWGSENIFEMQE